MSVPDPRISRRHLLLRPGPDGWQWRDLGSKNGTRRLDADTGAPLSGVAWLSLGAVLLRTEARAATRLRDRPEDVLSDVLPLTGAVGAAVWADPSAGPSALSIGEEQGVPETRIDAPGLTLILRGGDAPAGVERDLVLAIARQSLILARALESGADIETARGRAGA